MRAAGSEQQVAEQLARYMQLRHPDVLYRFDLAADLKLTVGQAARHKRLHPHRGWPDLFIAAPAKRPMMPGGYCHGLFVELKRQGTRLTKRNGEWASEHLEEQAVMLSRLRDQGYDARFACGFEEAQQLIDNYIGGRSDADTKDTF